MTLADGRQRSDALERFLERFQKEADIPDSVLIAADHPGHCRCDLCLRYWAVEVGPEMDVDKNGQAVLMFGPFAHDEIRAYLTAQGIDADKQFADWAHAAIGGTDDEGDDEENPDGEDAERDDELDEEDDWDDEGEEEEGDLDFEERDFI